MSTCKFCGLGTMDANGGARRPCCLSICNHLFFSCALVQDTTKRSTLPLPPANNNSSNNNLRSRAYANQVSEMARETDRQTETDVPTEGQTNRDNSSIWKQPNQTNNIKRVYKHRLSQPDPFPKQTNKSRWKEVRHHQMQGQNTSSSIPHIIH